MIRLDPNNPTPGDLLYVKIDKGFSSVLDKFYRVAAWDSKLKLHWIRYCLLPIILIPNIKHAIEWYSEYRHISFNQLIESLPWVIYYILSVLANSYIWFNQSGLLHLIVAPLFAFGFLSTLRKSDKSERRVRQKVTISSVIGVVVNYAFLLMGAKYLLPGFHRIIIIILVISAALELFRIPALHRFQKENGPLDVERFQIKRDRKMRRQEKESKKE